MKKFYTTAVIGLLLFNILFSAVSNQYYNRNIKNTGQILKINQSFYHFNKQKTVKVNKTSRLKAQDGGEMYAVDSVAISDYLGNHLGYEKYFYDETGNILEWYLLGLYYFEEEDAYYYLIDQYGIYQYNEYSLPVIYEQFSWNTDEEDYTGDTKQVFQYTSSGYENEYIEYTWNLANKDWLESFKETSMYDGDNNKTASNFYTWKTFDEKWIKYGSKEYFYDSLKNHVYSIETNFEDTNNIKTYWDTLIYSDNNLIEAFTYNLNNSDSTWVEMSNSSWVYTNGINTKYVFRYLDEETELWEGIKNEYKYNEYGWRIQEKYYIWDSSSEIWVLMYIYDIYWDELDKLILSTPEINANPEIKAYPNPVTDFLTISMNTISQVQYKILNAVGKTVLSGILNESVQQINMSGLPQGIYFISLDINGMQEVKKIIK